MQTILFVVVFNLYSHSKAGQPHRLLVVPNVEIACRLVHKYAANQDIGVRAYQYSGSGMFTNSPDVNKIDCLQKPEPSKGYSLYEEEIEPILQLKSYKVIFQEAAKKAADSISVGVK